MEVPAKPPTGFEYGAILKGSQTKKRLSITGLMFEYGAILKGSQTGTFFRCNEFWFEYGAILKGSQTFIQVIKKRI